ncbi:hypothetical protein Tco_1399210, partial [Tanacetum coccineum]
MIPTNIAPLVDLSIRNTGRPVTRQPMTQDMRNDILNSKTDRPVIRQPMTQDMRNEILNSKKPAERPPRQVNTHENTLQQVTKAIQPSKRPRGRPRFDELQTCNVGQSVHSIPRPRGRPRKEEISTVSSKQDTLYPGNSTLLTSDMHNLKGKRITSIMEILHFHANIVSRGKVKIGGKVDDTVNYGRGPFCYRIHGENYHRVCSLFPGTGDFDNTKNKRDIILLQQDGDLKRISKLHPQYLAMQYPLFSHTPRTDTVQIYSIMALQTMMKKNKGTRVTMKEWFSYRVQERENEFSMMLNGRRLFQQFPVDGYIMIEAERMSFNRKQQKDLRSETYSKLAKLAEDPESGVQLCGKKVVLSSSFTGSP